MESPQETDAGEYLGDWWRFDRYELRAGCIMPAPDAKLESYNPWAAYWESVRGSSARPYQDLVRLGHLLPESGARRAMGNEWRGGVQFIPYGEELDAEVLSWCARYGLLGLLPGRARVVVLAPRWARDTAIPTVPPERVLRSDMTEEEARNAVSFARLDGLAPQQITYVRRASGWSIYETHQHFPRMEPVTEGGVVASEWIPPSWPVPSAILEPDSVTVTSVNEVLRPEPLGKTWARYFPTVGREEVETYAYPTPFSEAFWRLYAEPAYDIFFAARLLYQTLDILSGQFTQPSEVSREIRIQRASNILTRMAAGVSPALFQHVAGGYRQAFIAPSLLSAFAMMMALDLGRHGRARQCQRCGVPFLPHTPRAKFCSPKCQRTSAQAQRRNRQQEALETALERTAGITPTAVAAKVARSLLRNTGSVERLRGAVSGPRLGHMLELARRHAPQLTARQLAAAVKKVHRGQ
jgi:hypothetical protein